MAERVLNCLQNDYDVYIVAGFASLCVLIIVLYYKYGDKRHTDPTNRKHFTVRETIPSSGLYASFITIIMLCLIYLICRMIGVLPNQLSR